MRLPARRTFFLKELSETSDPQGEENILFSISTVCY